MIIIYIDVYQELKRIFVMSRQIPVVSDRFYFSFWKEICGNKKHSINKKNNNNGQNEQQ